MLTKVHHFYAGQQILRDPFGTCRIILQALHDFCFTGRHSGKVTVKTQNAKRRRKKAKSVTTVDPVFSEQLLRRQIQRVNRFLNNESLVIMIIWVQQCRLSCAVWIVKQPQDNTVIQRLRNLTDRGKKIQNIQEDVAEFLNRPSRDTTATSQHNQKPHDHAKSSGA